MVAFSERLKRLRKEKHLSQETLAGLVNVHNNTVSKWEHGVIPHMKKVTELAEILGTTSAYLLGEDREDDVQVLAEENSPVADVKLTPSIDDPAFMERLVKSHTMIVYEQGNERIFVPATDAGFNFIKAMRAANNGVNAAPAM